jgi:flagellar biosynthesis/type III secretory pathway protein FliH
VTVPDFIPLADVLRPRAIIQDELEPPHAIVPAAVDHTGIALRDGTDAVLDDSVRDAIRDARLFRARLADAFDAALASLLRELAAGVLARELRLAPCDIGVLVRQVIERAPVVRLRLAPSDASSSAAVRSCGLPVVEDASLDAGDAVFELAGGALDARLGTRLAAALEAV